MEQDDKATGNPASIVAPGTALIGALDLRTWSRVPDCATPPRKTAAGTATCELTLIRANTVWLDPSVRLGGFEARLRLRLPEYEAGLPGVFSRQALSEMA